MRWDFNTSGIGVESNNFESRCWAQHDARLAYQFLLKSGRPIPPGYTVPINFIPNYLEYTAEQQEDDKREALKIFNSSTLVEQNLKEGHPEFLFLIDIAKYETQFLALLQYNAIPLIPWLIFVGQFEIAESIYEQTSLAAQWTLGECLDKKYEYAKFQLHIPKGEALKDRDPPIFAAISPVNRMELA